jgi:hypothetical protein
MAAIAVNAGSTAAASSVAPIARAPASAPNRNIGAAGDITIVRPAAAAPPRRPEQVEMRRARVFGDHCQCCRFSDLLSMTPWLAPAPADIIDRPSSIVAPNQTANNNPLKRKGDVDQQPYSRLEPVGLLGAARSHSVIWSLSDNSGHWWILG